MDGRFIPLCQHIVSGVRRAQGTMKSTLTQVQGVRPIAINGRFLTQAITGVQRYALEVIHALDNILTQEEIPHQVEILAPPGTPMEQSFRSIRLRVVGWGSGQIWEQTSLPFFCRGSVLFTPTGGSPLLHRRNVFTLPDAGVFATPEAYSTAYCVWYRAHHRLAVTNPDLKLLTVSEFSRKELSYYLHLDPNSIAMIPEGHEHALRPLSDLTVLDRLGLTRGSYLLGVGSANPNKNFATLIAAFAHLRDSLPTGQDTKLVVVGGADPRIFGAEGHTLEGVLRAGYLSDEELRALYENAVAFVFPSIYEGFGLPPLEAMALGCPVICSNAASLPEVAGDAAIQVDPYDVEGIAAAMRKLVTDPAAREELIARGYRQIQHFQWHNAALATWQLLLQAARS
jgi:glycosyltransferase involved in cell wall biosynthesis